ncbi:MAG: MurR/RpiR family transcriptional regulator [Anaerolineae bacterium]|nr:MurR/RpiR family transcriptional regulator [Anaerolineae bacterium]
MFKERIRENYEELTPGFRKLANFIMDNTLDVAFLTATELSRRVGVDPATVVRFAQELGYSGFRELSREIKRYVRDRVTASYRKVGDAETTEDVLRGLIDNAGQNIEHFVTTDLASVVEAVELLKTANHVWCTGEFTGFDIAHFLARKFTIHGLPATAFEPSMAGTSTALSQMQKGDVLLTFAGNDPSVDAGYAVRLANDIGLATITVTGSGVVLAARHADVSIIVPYKSPAGVPSFGPMMQVVSLIWEAVMTPKQEVVREKVAELQDTMIRLLGLRAETPEYEVAAPQNIWRDNLDR